jgi:hypothetical protein
VKFRIDGRDIPKDVQARGQAAVAAYVRKVAANPEAVRAAPALGRQRRVEQAKADNNAVLRPLHDRALPAQSLGTPPRLQGAAGVLLGLGRHVRLENADAPPPHPSGVRKKRCPRREKQHVERLRSSKELKSSTGTEIHAVPHRLR